MIYLDNAATTRVSDVAANAALDAMQTAFGNPSSLHGLGIRAENIMKKARESIAKRIGAEKNEIVFTSGGTEGNNLAIFGAAAANMRRGKHIITSAVEHASVLQPMRSLESRGFRVTYLPHSELTPEGVCNAICEDTILVSIMSVNNEIGAVYPIDEIAKAIKRKHGDIVIHTDAVQAFLKIPLSLRRTGVDLLTISGHKIHAPKGIGALYVRRGVRIKAVNLGGGQENALRSGTENLPGIAALGVACEQDLTFGNKLCYFKDELKKIDAVKILYDGKAPHIISLATPGYPSEVAMRMLEARGVYVSSGSACSKGKRSHVLEEIKIPPKLIDCAIRISISSETTIEEIDAACRVFKELFDKK